MPETPITTTAVVLEALGPVTYHLRLPNGKEIVGHLSRALRDCSEGSPAFQPGDPVRVEMTPYDFSKARITGPESSVR